MEQLDRERHTSVRPVDSITPEPSSRRQLSDEAASYIRALILSGQLQPDDYIRLQPIAKELEISLTPVREGLLALRAEGLIRLEPRRGFRVESLTTGDILDMFLVQSFISQELARRACDRATEAGLVEIEAICRELETCLAANDGPSFDALNERFHCRINDLAESPKLAWLYARGTPMPRKFFSIIPGWMELQVADHRVIVRSLRARDARAVSEEMANHVMLSGRMVVEHLELKTRKDRNARETSQHSMAEKT